MPLSILSTHNRVVPQGHGTASGGDTQPPVRFKGGGHVLDALFRVHALRVGPAPGQNSPSYSLLTTASKVSGVPRSLIRLIGTVAPAVSGFFRSRSTK